MKTYKLVILLLATVSFALGHSNILLTLEKAFKSHKHREPQIINTKIPHVSEVVRPMSYNGPEKLWQASPNERNMVHPDMVREIY
jgi:hypothetical protein